jgi:hypothetical protein
MMSTLTLISVRLNDFARFRPNNNAVGGNDITGIESHNVTDNKIPHVDSLHSALLAALYGQLRVLVLRLKLNKLTILNEIVDGSDKHHNG